VGLFRPYSHDASASSTPLVTTAEPGRDVPSPDKTPSEPAGTKPIDKKRSDKKPSDTQPSGMEPAGKGKAKDAKATPGRPVVTPAQAPAPAQPDNRPKKKQIPTPTRRQAENARRQLLTPTLTKKEQRARDREVSLRAREEAMSKDNAQPMNQLIRDYVDSRLCLAEFALPVMLLIIVSMFITVKFPALYVVMMLLTYAVLAAVVFDTTIMWSGLRRQLRHFFPNASLKGRFWYAMSRSMMIRRSRQPRPRVKRRTKFVWPPATTTN